MPLSDPQLLLQPLFGAAIGYLTNAVAIRMLFRPLRPWRVFGLRVPMTPGVIPAKRAQLARNIGEMVGGHLFTSDDVQRAIQEESFQRELAGLLDERLDAILRRDLGPLPTLIPERFRAYFHAGVKILRWRGLRKLHAHIESDAFGAQLIRAVETRLPPFLNRVVTDPAAKTIREDLFALLESAMATALAKPWVEEWTASMLQGFFATIVREEKSLADLLPEEVAEFLLLSVEQQAPLLLEKLGHLLRDPAAIEKIAFWSAETAKKFIASFGPMAGLISGFVSPETLKGKIEEYLASHGDEVQALLLDDATREKLATLLRNKSDEWLHAPLARILPHVPPEKLEQWFTWASRRLAHALRRQELVKATVACLRRGFEADGARHLEEALGRPTLGPDGSEDFRARAAGAILALVRGPSTRGILDDMVIDLVEHRLMEHPIGRLADLLPREARTSMNGFLFEQVSDILAREVPPLVDTLGIRAIVARKVDSLDLPRLEDLLMGIMKEQFKYINLFGALLGFLIGLINLLPLLLS